MENTKEASNTDVIVNGKPEGTGQDDAFDNMFDQNNNQGNVSPKYDG